METDLPFVTAPWLQAYFTPSEQHSAEMKEVLRLSDELVAELLATDHLVIATPVYNYNVPAALKAWIDHIVRKGLTPGVDGSGLLTGKKATVLLASGGVYTDGSPIRDRDIATQYIRLTSRSSVSPTSPLSPQATPRRSIWAKSAATISLPSSKARSRPRPPRRHQGGRRL